VTGQLNDVSVAGQLELDSSVRDVLGRARFESCVRAFGSGARWEDQSEPTRDWWVQPAAPLIRPVLQLLERAAADRVSRATWAVGAADRTMAANRAMPALAWCGDGCGEWICSRADGHPRDLHAAGDGITIRAAWAVST